MAFQLLELSVNFPGAIYVTASITAAAVVVAMLPRGHSLDAFPTVGSSDRFFSWFAGFKNMVNMADIVQDGYQKHKPAPFKVAEPYNWLVVLTDRRHIKEIRNISEDVLSLGDAVNERLNSIFTLGSPIVDNPIHIALTLQNLTRNLGTLYPEIRDEIIASFDEVLDLSHEWKSVPVLGVMRQIVCRTSNRVFVGLPLCRDPDWVDLNIQHTIELSKAGTLIGMFPRVLRPLVAHFFTGPLRRDRARCLKYMGQVIEERLRCLHEYGNEWDGKPNDLVSWLMEQAKGPQLRTDILAAHVVLVNFSAIQAASFTFASVLFRLAENAEHVQTLREEVEGIVWREGWSRESVSKMHKVDSFLKECQRLDGTAATGIIRKAIKDITLSDGTLIPKGTTIGIATRALLYDEELYANADAFEPFRFVAQEGGAKSQFISTTDLEYLSFGSGRHACTGRFFAADELKTMLAHVVMTYDVKFEDSPTRPRSVHSGIAILADPYAKILFRKRAA